jgi:hypothetical protein
VPVNDTVWGLPAASSDIESVPVTSPAPSGVNVTPIEQAPSDVRLPTQLSVSAKLLLVVMPATFSATLP